MSRRVVFVFISVFAAIAQLSAQPAGSPAATAEKKSKEKKEKEPSKPGSTNPLQSNEPTTTEIYADEAFFDSNKNIGIFTGHVKVTDPRFNLQSEKLTVYVSKGQNQGLEKAVAEGDVAMVRDRPDPNGGPPTRSVGRADKATYTSSNGDVELAGTPRVQEGMNVHIANSPDTIMIVNQSGQLTTHGPSRTEIRQEPKSDQTGGKASPSPSASKKP